MVYHLSRGNRRSFYIPHAHVVRGVPLICIIYVARKEYISPPSLHGSLGCNKESLGIRVGSCSDYFCTLQITVE